MIQLPSITGVIAFIILFYYCFSFVMQTKKDAMGQALWPFLALTYFIWITITPFLSLEKALARDINSALIGLSTFSLFTWTLLLSSTQQAKPLPRKITWKLPILGTLLALTLYRYQWIPAKAFEFIFFIPLLTVFIIYKKIYILAYRQFIFFLSFFQVSFIMFHYGRTLILQKIIPSFFLIIAIWFFCQIINFLSVKHFLENQLGQKRSS